jgi:hypothetical protein
VQTVRPPCANREAATNEETLVPIKAESSSQMNVPGRDQFPEDRRGGKWTTIRYAIERWGTTIRLLLVLLALSVPTVIIALLARR